MKKILVASLVLVPLAVFAADKAAEMKTEPKAEAPKNPADMPEVKKVVASFEGKWTWDSTLTMPDGKSEKIAMTADCKSIAMGVGVSCTMAGKSKMAGPMEMSCMSAHDPSGTGVHMMCITNGGEVHDHVGSWTDEKTLTFQPLKWNNMGTPSTEDLMFKWSDANNLTYSSTTTMDNGAKMTFAGSGKRAGKKGGA